MNKTRYKHVKVFINHKICTSPHLHQEKTKVSNYALDKAHLALFWLL